MGGVAVGDHDIGVVQQLVQQTDMPLLRGDQLVLDQLRRTGIHVVQRFFVILEPVLFAFLQRF